MSTPLGTRLLLVLYSTRNIVGCLLALCGLALFFAGVIESWWLPIVVGLYVGGFLLVPSPSIVHELDLKELADESLLENFDRLLGDTQRALPREARALLEKIRGVVAELIPRLRAGTSSAALDQLFTVRQALGRDLPLTVTNYIKLPPAFAAVHPLEGGKPARRLLLDQLDLLHRHLEGLHESMLRDDAEALVNNGRFLKEKFHKLDFVGT